MYRNMYRTIATCIYMYVHVHLYVSTEPQKQWDNRVSSECTYIIYSQSQSQSQSESIVRNRVRVSQSQSQSQSVGQFRVYILIEGVQLNI